ncbi:N-acetyltransferase [Rhodobacteraceae bacterium R_SAG10]|nr:N-acetyltransferase [Rhodobacteraceae bacterium R_SAG10]
MRVRSATTDDAGAIAAFWAPMIRDTHVMFERAAKSARDVAAMITECAARGHAFLVAEEAGRVVGFATYRQFRAGSGYAHTMEHTIIVAPQGQGSGVGRGLLGALEDHARTAGARSMIAAISGENRGAVAFHNALGYCQVGVVPEAGRKFDRWLDLHLMQKIL